MLLEALLEVGDVCSSELLLPESGRRVFASFAEGEREKINSVVSANIEFAVRNRCLLFRYCDVTWIQDELLAELGIVGYKAGVDVNRVYLLEGIESAAYIDVGFSLGLFDSFGVDVIQKVVAFSKVISEGLSLFSIFSVSKTQIVYYFWNEDEASTRPLIEEVFRFNREILKFQKPKHEAKDEIANCVKKGFFWLGDG